jgi:cytochrome P450
MAFDVERSNARQHLAFGHGSHLCVGAPLARLELVACLNAILDRIPTMRLVDPASFDPLSRPASLKVVFSPS